MNKQGEEIMIKIKTTKNPVFAWFRTHSGSLIGLIVLAVIATILSDKFLTVDNILNVLKAVSSNLMLGSALTMIIILGGIDISVGAVVGVSGMIAAELIGMGTPIWLGLLCCIAVGLFFGLINGFFISKVSLPPFIVTLATMNIARGLTQVICNGIPVRVSVAGFNEIGTVTVLGGVSVVPLYSVVFVILAMILMYNTRVGSYIYAIGGNRTAAEFSGINVKKIIMVPYLISGFFASICGIVWTARIGSGSPSLGMNFELDAIAATALGGTSMSGGVGKLGGTMIGVFIIGVINNGLNLINLNSFWQLVVKGFVVLLSVVIDALRKQRAEKAR